MKFVSAHLCDHVNNMFYRVRMYQKCRTDSRTRGLEQSQMIWAHAATEQNDAGSYTRYGKFISNNTRATRQLSNQCQDPPQITISSQSMIREQSYNGRTPEGHRRSTTYLTLSFPTPDSSQWALAVGFAKHCPSLIPRRDVSGYVTPLGRDVGGHALWLAA